MSDRRPRTLALGQVKQGLRILVGESVFRGLRNLTGLCNRPRRTAVYDIVFVIQADELKRYAINFFRAHLQYACSWTPLSGRGYSQQFMITMQSPEGDQAIRMLCISPGEHLCYACVSDVLVMYDGIVSPAHFTWFCRDIMPMITNDGAAFRGWHLECPRVFDGFEEDLPGFLL